MTAIVVNTPSQFVIIRGLPGSGKSTLASALAKKFKHYSFEADNFYEHVDLQGNSEYKFNDELIEYAHYHCQGNVAYFLNREKNVVVSNTTTNWNQLQQYLKMASRLNIKNIDIVECTDDFGDIHRVPEEVYVRMQKNWITNKQISELQYYELYKDNCTMYTSKEYKQIMGV